MRPSLVSPAFAVLVFLITSSNALQAIASSPCAVKCGNVLGSTTGEGDIACYDREYGLLSKANLFQGCINCQLTSKYVDPTTKQTDLQWALYNLRYAVSWCLYGFPNNTDVGTTPCFTSTACGTLENAFEFDSLSPNATAYGYCGLMHQEIVPKCTACLAQGDEFFITNYVTALSAACQQQPIPGTTISIEGSLFSKTRVNITDPDDVHDSVHNPNTSGLTLGVKVGIAVGAIVVLLSIAACCIVWRGKRRRRNMLAKRQRESGYADWVSAQVAARSPNPMGSPGFFDSPQSQRPLYPDRSWGMGVKEDESPQSNTGEKVYFSPYSSHYSSPVSASDQVQVIGREWPSEQGNVAGATGVGKVVGRSRSREKRSSEGDRIEMQHVAPVLLHPGQGRGLGLNTYNRQSVNAF